MAIKSNVLEINGVAVRHASEIKEAEFDSDMFVFADYNRDVALPRKNRIIKSIETLGCKPTPIICTTRDDGKLIVIDGQGRLEAFRETKSKIFYCVDNSLGQDHVIGLNINRRRWSDDDHINFYMASDSKAVSISYTVLNKALKEFPTLPRRCVYALIRDNGTPTSYAGITPNEISRGAYRCTEESFSEKRETLAWVAEAISAVHGEISGMSAMASALAFIYDNVDLNHEVVKTVIIKNIGKFSHFKRIDEMLKEIENMYRTNARYGATVVIADKYKEYVFNRAQIAKEVNAENLVQLKQGEFSLASRLPNVTYDLSIFKRYPGYREPDGFRVKAVIDSMKKIGYIGSCLVECDENMYVCDGLVRIEACRQLGLPVYYVVIRGMNADYAKAMNAISGNWGDLDYISSYAKRGNENYSRLDGIVKKYKGIFTARMIASVATGGYGVNGLWGASRQGSNTISKLRKGTLVIDELQARRADSDLKWMTQFVPLFKDISSKEPGCVAMLFCRNRNLVDIQKLVDALKKAKARGTLARTNSVQDMLSQFSDAYNYGRQAKHRINLAVDYEKYIKMQNSKPELYERS